MSWQEAQRGVKSLVVQFTLETRDTVYQDRQKLNGTLRLIRTPKGAVLASCEVTRLGAKSENLERRYTTLAVKPKQVPQPGWFPDSFQQGRVVLMRKASDAIPKGMPWQLWYTDGIQECTFEIKSWRINAAEAPKPEEFAKPEDRPGWTVREWPFWKTKHPG